MSPKSSYQPNSGPTLRLKQILKRCVSFGHGHGHPFSLHPRRRRRRSKKMGSTSLCTASIPDAITSIRESFKSLFHNGSQNRSSITFIPSPKNFRFSVRCTVRFRPCIDIHRGKVKQIVGSTLRDSKEDESVLVTNFESDKSAAEFASLYRVDGLVGGHVIMLGADPLSKAAAIEALHAYPGGLQIGGGINSDNSLSYIEEGASHVIVTSYVFNNGRMDLDRLKDLVRVVGKQRLVLDLSCGKKEGKYAIVTDRWQKFTDVYLDEEVLGFLADYSDEILVHGVDVEGKKLGIDEELVALLGRYCPIPVTYAGGVTAIEDLDRIKVAGMGRVDVTVGSALDIFGGNLAYRDVVAWHFQQEALTV